MGIRVTHEMDDARTTANMRLLSLTLLSVSIFFFLLFFVYWSANGNNASSPIDTEEGTPYLYHLMIIITTLTIALMVMHFYTSPGGMYKFLRYGVIIGNAVIIGFAIHQLTRGVDQLFGDGDDKAHIEYTYSGLGIGFAGAGTLLCLIHNFYGISKTIQT